MNGEWLGIGWGSQPMCSKPGHSWQGAANGRCVRPHTFRIDVHRIRDRVGSGQGIVGDRKKRGAECQVKVRGKRENRGSVTRR